MGRGDTAWPVAGLIIWLFLWKKPIFSVASTRMGDKTKYLAVGRVETRLWLTSPSAYAVTIMIRRPFTYIWSGSIKSSIWILDSFKSSPICTARSVDSSDPNYIYTRAESVPIFNAPNRISWDLSTFDYV